MPINEHAQAIRDHYVEAPGDTIHQVAEALEIAPAEVAEVLDTHQVDSDGKIKDLGAGQGGGWVPTVPEPELRGTHIGYRWPDGCFHDQPYEPGVPPGRSTVDPQGKLEG